MNMHAAARALSSRVRHSTLGVFAGLLALGAAAPAPAGHETAPTSETPAWSVNVRLGERFAHWYGPATRHANPAPSCGPVRSVTEIHFDRGFAAGTSDGWAAGVREGRRGKPRCTMTPHPPGRVSPWYRRGYRAGFADGYAEGFARGRALRWGVRGGHRRWAH